MMHPFLILLSDSSEKGVHFMYTGSYDAQKSKHRGHRRKLNIPGILFDGVVILLCIFTIGKAIGAIRNLFASDIPMLVTPTETETTAPQDRIAPEITGVHDFTVYQGDAVAYRSGISVTDNDDLSPILNVDPSGVDLTIPGTYEVIYTATDASGNVATANAMVTVLMKKEGYVDLETVEDAANALLESILWPEATTREKVQAIYTWARTHIGYDGHSDRTDWRQTAYTVMQELRGDCFGYYAVCKLLFEQLEIPNMDVIKVKNSETDSEHFWSLVSIDGGESYYHFDATPRYGEGDDFCLVTDAFLDAYSASHKNSHNRDTALYPATPKEDLP